MVDIQMYPMVDHGINSVYLVLPRKTLKKDPFFATCMAIVSRYNLTF